MKIATRKLTERANAELPKRMASARAGEGDKIGCRAAGRLLWSIVGFLLVLNWAVIVDPQTDPATNNLLTHTVGNRLALFSSLPSVQNQTSSFNSRDWLTSDSYDANNPTGFAQVVEEYRNVAAGTTATVYTYGNDLISRSVVAPGSTLPALAYFSYDGLGSVRELTNASGAVTDTYDYDAFGVLLARTGTTANDYLYRGEQFDADLGLYYLRARYLNPASGRFWNQDTFEGSTSDPASLHKYLYANGDPVGRIDPSGHLSLVEIGVTLGISATINVALVVPTIRPGEDSVADIGKKLGVAAVEGAAVALVGGIAGRVVLKMVPQVRWLLARGAISGAGGGAAAQVAKEFYEVVFNRKPVNIKDSAGRVFIATLVGFGIGGVTFKVQPIITKTVNPSVTNAQGFQQTIPWIERTVERLSPSGVAGALGAEATNSVIADWLESSLNLDSN